MCASWLATVFCVTISNGPDDFHRMGTDRFLRDKPETSSHVTRIQNFAPSDQPFRPGRGLPNPVFQLQEYSEGVGTSGSSLAATPKEEILTRRRRRRRAFNARPDLLALVARRGGRQLSSYCSF